MKLRTALSLLLACSIGTTLCLGATTLWSARQLDASTQRALVAKDVTADILPPPMYLIEARLVLSQLIEGSMPLAVATAELERLEKEYLARVQYWQQNPPYGLERELLGAQHDAGLRFLAEAKGKVLAAAAHGNAEAAKAALGEVHTLYLAHRKGVDDTVKASGTFAEAAMQQFARVQQGSQWLAAAMTLLGALLLGGLTLLARRTVLRSIGAEPQDLAARSAAMAGGDLTSPIDTPHADSIAGSMERMRASLAGLIGTALQNTRHVVACSGELAAGNRHLSERTEAAASSLQQTASSMEELNGTVKQTVDAAQTANRLAGSASTAATQGGAVVEQVVTTMEEISASSKRIADIIGVIDGIAFQTNLLALNAAVEAARAGEQGRGFAVVAGEVRTLAQRSAQAAHEIKALIGASVEKTESGARLVRDAGAAMGQIVESVRRVSEVIGEISTAAAEQHDGIGQVVTAVNRLDDMTQQNSALAEQSITTTETLKDQAGRLAQVLSDFRLGAQPRAA